MVARLFVYRADVTGKRMENRASLDGRVVVVTGASSGIGAAIARRLVDDGATVIGACRSRGEVEGVHWVSCDVTRAAEVDHVVDDLLARHGRLDALVNNAGIQVERTVVDTTDVDFDRLVDTNFRGVFHGCRAAVRAMRGRGGGVIVNVGSTAAEHADGAMAVYNATKGAVHALTRSVAVDHGPDGIRCVAVAPGWIAHRHGRDRLRRHGRPERRSAPGRGRASRRSTRSTRRGGGVGVVAAGRRREPS